MRRELGAQDLPLTRISLACGVLQGDLGTALTNGRDIRRKSLGGRLQTTTVLRLLGRCILPVHLAIFLSLAGPCAIKDRWRKLISATRLTDDSLIPRIHDRTIV